MDNITHRAGARGVSQDDAPGDVPRTHSSRFESKRQRTMSLYLLLCVLSMAGYATLRSDAFLQLFAPPPSIEVDVGVVRGLCSEDKQLVCDTTHWITVDGVLRGKETLASFVVHRTDDEQAATELVSVRFPSDLAAAAARGGNNTHRIGIALKADKRARASSKFRLRESDTICPYERDIYIGVYRDEPQHPMDTPFSFRMIREVSESVQCKPRIQVHQPTWLVGTLVSFAVLAVLVYLSRCCW